MVIAIDARFYGTENTGLGRYTQNVLEHLFRAEDQNHYIVFVAPKYQNLTFPGNVTIVPIRVKHYTLLEQIILPYLIIKYKCNLLYTLHFNAPIFCPVPTVVTIHDLIKSHFVAQETSTHNSFIFRIKRWGYNLVISSVITRALKIIVPTLSVKSDILELYPGLDSHKIYPVHEAVDRVFAAAKSKKIISPKRKYSRLLFVGNAYPHKNLPVLLQAFTILQKSGAYYLTLLSHKTPFLKACLASVEASVARYIIVKEGVSDAELLRHYQESDLLITPSLMEGFGLPGLEALSVGTPVAASDIPVYREVYQNNVTYFEVSSAHDLVRAIKLSLSSKPVVFKSSRTWQDVATDIRQVLL